MIWETREHPYELPPEEWAFYRPPYSPHFCCYSRCYHAFGRMMLDNLAAILPAEDDEFQRQQEKTVRVLDIGTGKHPTPFLRQLIAVAQGNSEFGRGRSWPLRWKLHITLLDARGGDSDTGDVQSVFRSNGWRHFFEQPAWNSVDCRPDSLATRTSACGRVEVRFNAEDVFLVDGRKSGRFDLILAHAVFHEIHEALVGRGALQIELCCPNEQTAELFQTALNDAWRENPLWFGVEQPSPWEKLAWAEGSVLRVRAFPMDDVILGTKLEDRLVSGAPDTDRTTRQAMLGALYGTRARLLQALFVKLAEELMLPGGRLVVGDFFFAEWMDAEQQRKAIRRIDENFGFRPHHFDYFQPPSALLRPALRPVTVNGSVTCTVRYPGRRVESSSAGRLELARQWIVCGDPGTSAQQVDHGRLAGDFRPTMVAATPPTRAQTSYAPLIEIREVIASEQSLTAMASDPGIALKYDGGAADRWLDDRRWYFCMAFRQAEPPLRIKAAFDLLNSAESRVREAIDGVAARLTEADPAESRIAYAALFQQILFGDAESDPTETPWERTPGGTLAGEVCAFIRAWQSAHCLRSPEFLSVWPSYASGELKTYGEEGRIAPPPHREEIPQTDAWLGGGGKGCRNYRLVSDGQAHGSYSLDERPAWTAMCYNALLGWAPESVSPKSMPSVHRWFATAPRVSANYAARVLSAGSLGECFRSLTYCPPVRKDGEGIILAGEMEWCQAEGAPQHVYLDMPPLADTPDADLCAWGASIHERMRKRLRRPLKSTKEDDIITPVVDDWQRRVFATFLAYIFNPPCPRRRRPSVIRRPFDDTSPVGKADNDRFEGLLAWLDGKWDELTTTQHADISPLFMTNIPVFTPSPPVDRGEGRSTGDSALGSLIIFTDRPLAGPLLDILAHLARSLFSRVREIEGEAAKVRRKQAEEQVKRLAIVAGTSHAFKNLLTPLRAGLAFERDAYLQALLRARQQMKADGEVLWQDNCVDQLLKRGIPLHDSRMQYPLLEAVSKLSSYRVVVERLWAKVYALHLASLETKPNLAKWNRECRLSELVLTSFYCSWHAFMNDGAFAWLRKKHVETEMTGGFATLRLAINELGPMDFACSMHEQAARPSRLGDRVWVSGFDCLTGAAKRLGDRTEALAAVVLEAFFEEALLNAIKYGCLACPICVRIRFGADRKFSCATANCVQRETVDDRNAGHGRRFIHTLIEVCGGKHTDSGSKQPPASALVDAVTSDLGEDCSADFSAWCRRRDSQGFSPGVRSIWVAELDALELPNVAEE